jgi:hypothetical protein
MNGLCRLSFYFWDVGLHFHVDSPSSTIYQLRGKAQSQQSQVLLENTALKISPIAPRIAGMATCQRLSLCLSELPLTEIMPTMATAEGIAESKQLSRRRDTPSWSFPILHRF